MAATPSLRVPQQPVANPLWHGQARKTYRYTRSSPHESLPRPFPKTLTVLLAAILVAAVFLSPMGRALASTNLDLDCKSAEIIEGGTLDVKVKGHWDGNLHVWWYTSDGTVIAGSDYPELDGVKQGSRKSGNTMTRTIETLDNLYPELNETFNLRFSRQDNHSDDTSCVLTIKDDDKGVRGMVISSSPADGLRYRAGEVIEFALHMNADVYINRILPPQISMDFRMEAGRTTSDRPISIIRMKPPIVIKRVVYVRYTVQVDDLDTNGVYVSHGDNTVGLTGSLLIYQYVPSRGGSNKGDPITKYYRGRHFKDGQVDGRPWVKSLDVISTPPDEETYYRTGEIELQVTFSEPMDVTGEPGVGFFIGGDDEDAQRQATYDRGSGTGTPVFKYAVQEEDTDGDGITVANGWKTNGLELDEGESIVSTDDDEASRYYKGIHDPLEDHKVDGSRTSSPVFVSAKTNESGNRVTVTFSKDVSPPSLLQTISDLFGVSLGRFYASVFDFYAEHTTRPSI